MAYEDRAPWWAGGAPSLLTVLLLSLSAAPFGQWYFAWVALAPWLVAIGLAPTIRSAFWRGLIAGIAYFAVNLWWLWTASITGTVVLVVYFGLFWGIAAVLLKSLGLLGPVRGAMKQRRRAGYPDSFIAWRVVAIAVVWVAAEWLRANMTTGFPWLPLGSTQTPLTVMCQVADLGGPWIVSFWVALPSALLAIYWIEGRNAPQLKAAAISVAAIIVAVMFYGAWRLYSTTTHTGPRVMVVQSNFEHAVGGAPLFDRQTASEYLLATVNCSLVEQSADLVVLPEALFPPVNDTARRALTYSPIGASLEDIYQRLLTISRDRHTALLVGGEAVTHWVPQGKEIIGSEVRNSAYYVSPVSDEPVARYDKVHLTRFSERAPLSFGPEWLRRLAMLISANRAERPLCAGDPSEFVPFHIAWTRAQPVAIGADPETTSVPAINDPSQARFICPICLENIDPTIITDMAFDSARSQKRAAFIANLSNDGWFATLEKYQHWQTTIFRCIENRVPMARSANTGISGFIDSCGRVQETIAPGAVGYLVRQIELDDRVTFYSHYGDVFAYACVLLTAAAVLFKISRRYYRPVLDVQA
jgi:apolipoprotein N-acyltransferase